MFFICFMHEDVGPLNEHNYSDLSSWVSKFILFFFFKFVCLFVCFLAVLGLRCCTRTFSSCGERGLPFIAVCGLLIAVSSLCGAWALGVRASVMGARGLSSCSTRALACAGFSSCGSRALERRLSSCSARA